MSTNYTELEPLISIVVKHGGTVLNGHDHCLGHYFSNNTNFILSGAAGFPQPGDCNNGTAPGPFAKYLAANDLQGECNRPCILLMMNADEMIVLSCQWIRDDGH